MLFASYKDIAKLPSLTSVPIYILMTNRTWRQVTWTLGSHPNDFPPGELELPGLQRSAKSGQSTCSPERALVCSGPPDDLHADLCAAPWEQAKNWTSEFTEFWLLVSGDLGI